MTAQKTIKTKERDTLTNRIKILNQVKPLVLIPKMEVMTTKMVADYFEVEYNVITKCYQKYKEKLIQDGVTKKTWNDFLFLKNSKKIDLNSFQQNPSHIAFSCNGYTITVSNAGVLCFPKKAILRLCSLLTDSKVAQKIQNKIINILNVNEKYITSLTNINKTNINNSMHVNNIDNLTEKNAIKERNKLINRIDILDKVKKILLIPKMNVFTTKMVADYFETDYNTITKCYQRNKQELMQDGVVKKKIADFVKLLDCNEMDNVSRTLIKTSTYISFKYDEYTVTIPNCGVLCFPKRAVLRIGMLLTESEIAQEVRTQLLNIVEKVDDKTKIDEIDKEQELCSKVGMAFLSGDINKIMIATTEAMNYKNRYINQLKNEQVKLSQINERLKTENNLLTKQTLKWGNKAVLNALIRKLSFVKDNGLVGRTWNSFYRDVKYKFGYDIKNRVGKGSYINKIKEKEFPNIISLAVSICKKNNIDINKVINEININNYNK